MDYKRQREEVVKVFEVLQSKLVELLEENINERPLHQLSLSEFNLHQEAKKERLKAVRNFKNLHEIYRHTYIYLVNMPKKVLKYLCLIQYVPIPCRLKRSARK